MNLKTEFSEYKIIYDVYFDTFKSLQESALEKEKEIFEVDKKDIEMQHESKEKFDMLAEYTFLVYKIQLVLNDLGKIAERLAYIYESSLRNSIDLELPEETKKFIQNVSENSSSAYAIQNGELVSKVEGLDNIIRKKVSEDKEKHYLHLDAIRKSHGGN